MLLRTVQDDFTRVEESLVPWSRAMVKKWCRHVWVAAAFYAPTQLPAHHRIL